MEKEQKKTQAKKKEESKNTQKRNRFIIAIFIIAIVFTIIFKIKNKPIKPLPPFGKDSTKIDYENLVNNIRTEVYQRNQNSLNFFEIEIAKVIKEHNIKLAKSAEDASKEASDYKSCCIIVYNLAFDKVKKQNTTETYLNKEIKPFLDIAIIELSNNVDNILKKYDYELRKNTIFLAKELAELGPKEDSLYIDIDVNFMDNVDVKDALKNLGFNATSISIFGIADIIAVFRIKLVKDILKKCTLIATKMFSKQVAKASATAILPSIDGPLPIGDILAIGGAIWTGYDIYASRKKFEKEIYVSFNNLLTELQNHTHQESIEYAKKILDKYQEMQYNIGSQSIKKLTK